MKKTLSILLSFIIALGLFSSCKKEEETVAVGKTTVCKGVYEYFVIQAKKEKNLRSEDEINALAKDYSLRYVAVNTKFEELKMELTSVQKAEASQKTNDYWHLFGDYYSSQGISKNDVYKVQLSEQYLKAIIRSIYDKDGSSPIPEEAVKAYFSDHFVVFRAIIELLATTDENGNAVDLTDEQIESVTKQFNQMKKSLDKGTKFEKVNAAYQSKNEESEATPPEIMIISETDHAFPEGTFGKIKEIDREKSGVFTSGKYIFLVERLGEFDDESFYDERRDECLTALGESAFEDTLASWVETLK